MRGRILFWLVRTCFLRSLPASLLHTCAVCSLCTHMYIYKYTHTYIHVRIPKRPMYTRPTREMYLHEKRPTKRGVLFMYMCLCRCAVCTECEDRMTCCEHVLQQHNMCCNNTTCVVRSALNVKTGSSHTHTHTHADTLNVNTCSSIYTHISIYT